MWARPSAAPPSRTRPILGSELDEASFCAWAGQPAMIPALRHRLNQIFDDMKITPWRGGPTECNVPCLPEGRPPSRPDLTSTQSCHRADCTYFTLLVQRRRDNWDK